MTDAEFDRWLAESAARMMIMDRKVKDRDITIRALVLAAGGKISVSRHEQIDAIDVELCVEENPAENARVFSARRAK